MCLGIPMKIVNINGFIARCSAKNVERDVNLFKLQDNNISVGEYVIVSAGYALQKITESDAQITWQLLEQILDKETENTQIIKSDKKI